MLYLCSLFEIASGNLFGSVVQNKKIEYGAGSSKPFNKAAQAGEFLTLPPKLWHSSIIKILYSLSKLLSLAALKIFLILSILPLLPPSNSIGWPKPWLIALAKARAQVVLPHPESPAKRYACLKFFCSIAFSKIFVVIDWPQISSSVLGLYLIANDCPIITSY